MNVMPRLDSEPFSDEAWQKSSVALRDVILRMAGSVKPFVEDPELPLHHAAALVMLGELIKQSRGGEEGGDVGAVESGAGTPTSMYSCLKFSAKKNGVAKVGAEVRGESEDVPKSHAVRFERRSMFPSRASGCHTYML